MGKPGVPKQIFSMADLVSKYEGEDLVGCYLKAFHIWMQERRNAQPTIRSHILGAVRFGKYLRQKGIESIQELNGSGGRALLAEYKAYLRNRGIRRNYHGTRMFLRGLVDTGVLRTSPLKDSSVYPVIAAYNVYCEKRKGLSRGTLYNQSLWLNKFLTFLGCEKTSTAVPIFGVEDVDRFLENQATKIKRITLPDVTTCLRNLIRFLYVSKAIPNDFSSLIPSPPVYKMSSIPKSTSMSDVQKILGSVDRTTDVGQRDYAILLLFSTYGLRSAEIAKLKMDDINWREESLKITERKSKHDLFLPLMPGVGRAILTYLKKARPKSKYREIFLLPFAPWNPMHPSSVRSRVGRYIGLAQVNPPFRGSHLFRHTLATHLLRHGIPLKHIGDLLGHRDPNATLIYAKTDVESLRGVALDVPTSVGGHIK